MNDLEKILSMLVLLVLLFGCAALMFLFMPEPAAASASAAARSMTLANPYNGTVNGVLHVYPQAGENHRGIYWTCVRTRGAITTARTTWYLAQANGSDLPARCPYARVSSRTKLFEAAITGSH